MLSTRFFRDTIYEYYRRHARDFPWRETDDPYRIMVSEIMLQQTQADRVIPKYKAWVKRFPTVNSLATARLRDVLALWQGLGYNRRAHALWRGAQLLVRDHHGRIPTQLTELDALPGIGKATACAITAFAFNQPVVFIETNIRTVFIHFFFHTKQRVTDEDLLPLISKTLDKDNSRDWYWALMDYGAMLKKQHPNPSRRSAHYTKQSPFLTSNRRIRGLIIKQLVTRPALSSAALGKKLAVDPRKIQANLAQLEKEGLISNHGRFYYIV